MNEINLLKIKYPLYIQLLFNYPDTIGSVLGFKKTGNKNSITRFNNVIKNTDLYEFESNTNNNISQISSKNNNENKYFYICCPELAHIENTAPVNDVFAIIRLDNNSNTITDSFVPTNKIFKAPLYNLNYLNISCKYPNGKPVNFDKRNHSFVIEITELYNQPLFTDIYARNNSLVFTNQV